MSFNAEAFNDVLLDTVVNIWSGYRLLIRDGRFNEGNKVSHTNVRPRPCWWICCVPIFQQLHQISSLERDSKLAFDTKHQV